MRPFFPTLLVGFSVAVTSLPLRAQGNWSSHDPTAALEYLKSLPSAGQAAALETILTGWNADWPTAADGTVAPTISLLPVLDLPGVLAHFHAPESIRDDAAFLTSPADLNRLFNDISGLNSLPAGYADPELFPALRLEFVTQYVQIQNVPEPSSWLLLSGGLGLLAVYAGWQRGGRWSGRQDFQGE